MTVCVNCKCRISSKYAKKFCSRSCAASYNNVNNPKRTNNEQVVCLFCRTKFSVRPQSVSRNLYCSTTCCIDHKNAIRLKKNSELLRQGLLKSRQYIREVLLSRRAHRCAICKLTEWNGKPITLWLDHIDGCAANNMLSNFRLICPNCDTQQPTFGAKNYGNGRKSLGLK